MRADPIRRAGILALFLLATAAFAGGVAWVGLRAALEQLEERGRADLALASDRLQSQLQGFRELAVLMADHPVLVPLALQGREDAEATRLLRETADKTGAWQIDLVGGDGRLLASSGGATALTGPDEFFRAMTGALGQGRVTGPPRVYVFAAPVFRPGGAAAGAVMVAVDAAAIEGSWPADPSPVFFSDAEGLIFIANRPELVGRSRDGDFPAHAITWFGTHELWSSTARFLPARALHLTQDLPVIGLTGELLLDTAPAVTLALWQGAVAGALCLAFGALLFLASERRKHLAMQLLAEERSKAQLEARVTERTRELSEANESLRLEVAERQAAEVRLKRAQEDLIQAGKLSALGRISAGISHELNQPLMAIRSFAENAVLYLERGDSAKAGENLERIAELARRMGRIIKNLRAFARAEPAAIRAVDLTAVLTAVLELTEVRMRTVGVTLDWQAPGPVWVRGGEVRLQQVAMNLVSNAIEAMEAQGGGTLSLRVDQGPGPVCLTIADTGPGIADPGRVFDPFYSTKDVGPTEGMGLGLSISYGLIQSFGGRIRGRNRPEGGAEFTVELQPAEAEQAA
ncbi:sensor histidine kinase [Frigidibacter sp. ROC022]|uniref:sensor histidine kinase n=1 Tax=Frigidibacter sp. ROC022 TaxID=2971796 RepID=UPI00215B272E|nr:ATP-binding protein [Frigidibacter sp. ROC022]MCR8725562.1 ATP-binding protein [Frigidibacter sp. ROC022]